MGLAFWRLRNEEVVRAQAAEQSVAPPVPAPPAPAPESPLAALERGLVQADPPLPSKASSPARQELLDRVRARSRSAAKEA